MDAQPADALPDDGMLDLVTCGEECEHLESLSTSVPGICWDRLLYSAKLSVYKAWFPLARWWLNFELAEIVIDAYGGVFAAHLLAPGPSVDGVRSSARKPAARRTASPASGRALRDSRAILPRIARRLVSAYHETYCAVNRCPLSNRCQEPLERISMIRTWLLLFEGQPPPPPFRGNRLFPGQWQVRGG